MITSQDLALQSCVPCKGGEASLTTQEIAMYVPSVPLWTIDEQGDHPQLVREIKLKNFAVVLKAVNAVGQLAEREGHHPNLYLHSYKQLRIEIFTHKTKGLHLNDFILARKIDLLPEVAE